MIKEKIDNMMITFEYYWVKHIKIGSKQLMQINDFILFKILYRNKPMSFWHDRVKKSADKLQESMDKLKEEL